MNGALLDSGVKGWHGNTPKTRRMKRRNWSQGRIIDYVFNFALMVAWCAIPFMWSFACSHCEGCCCSDLVFQCRYLVLEKYWKSRSWPIWLNLYVQGWPAWRGTLFSQHRYPSALLGQAWEKELPDKDIGLGPATILGRNDAKRRICTNPSSILIGYSNDGAMIRRASATSCCVCDSLNQRIDVQKSRKKESRHLG